MNPGLTLLMPHVLKRLPEGSKPFAIDIGVHDGDFAKFLINSRYFNYVLGFEPNPKLFSETLIQSADHCEFNFINKALSSKSGVFEFFCDGNTATGSLLQYEKQTLNTGEVQRNLVNVVRLDDFFEDYPSIGPLIFMKIDTQGNDLEVIKGSLLTIALHRPVLQVEFIYVSLYEEQCSPMELISSLSEINYILYSMNNLHVNPEGRLCYCDAIFIPKEFEIPSTQQYHCIDDQASFQSQLSTLGNICEERLSLINILDAEVKRLTNINHNLISKNSFFSKLKSWVR
jgi:FkbM family methyltransferase